MSNRFKSLRSRFFLSSLLAAASFVGAAHAQPTVLTVVPSDTVTRADFVRIGFDQEVIQLGSKAADPFIVECANTRVDGSGKWPDNRTWQYDFATAVIEPRDCVIRSNPEFRALNGERLEESQYAFKTGSLNVRVQPWSASQQISEDQHFILSFNGVVPAMQLEQPGY